MHFIIIILHYAENGGPMSYTNKPFEELDVIDDFLINAIATDEEVGVPFCRRLLSVLLQKEIGEIRVIAQRTLPASIPGLKGIRMDVEIEEADPNRPIPVANVYDLEPHLQKNMHIPKHNRFYQAKIDSRYLKSGETDFSKLPNLYVITITNFDPFGYDYMMYTIKNHCAEIPDLDYGDGLRFYYFNTKGTKGGSQEIKAMLQYIQDSKEINATDDATKEVHHYVSKVKVSPEVKIEYMKFDELMAYAELKGTEIGIEKGMQQGLQQGLQQGIQQGLQQGIQQGIQQGLQQGIQQGVQQGQREERIHSILELLEEKGAVPSELQQRVENEENMDILKSWFKVAAKTDSIEEFIEKIDFILM